ncbi:MAG: hypothetical protein LBQ27_05535 [Clostridiales bacterium]|nr:hypothetical protein [Clostridiales bacterium]
MSKKWYVYLTPAEEKRISPEFIPPSMKKAGRIKKTWDIFFLEYGTLLRVNLLLALTFFPFMIFCFTIFLRIGDVQSTFEYAMNTGIGYPLISVDNVGKTVELISAIKRESIFAFLLLLIPGPFFAGIFNITKLVMWGNTGIKLFKAFFEGIKKHWWKYAAIHTVFVGILYGVVYLALSHYQGTLTGETGALSWVALIAAAIVTLTLLTTMMYAFTMMPIYDDLKLRDILKNSFLFTAGLYPLNFVMAALSAAPLLVLLTGNVTAYIILLLVLVFLLFAIGTFVWTSYGQYGFESFINKIYAIYLAEKAKTQSMTQNGQKKDKLSAKTGNAYKNPKKKKKNSK